MGVWGHSCAAQICRLWEHFCWPSGAFSRSQSVVLRSRHSDASGRIAQVREIAERQLLAVGFLEPVAVEGGIEESSSLWLWIVDEQSDVALGEPIPALQ